MFFSQTLTLATLLLLLFTILQAQQQHQPPAGVSREVWQQTLNFEKDCTNCRTCTDQDYGFENYNKPYNPLAGVPKYWLHIVVGTIPRRASSLATNYLTQMLKSVEKQLNLPGVHLTIFNHRPDKHSEFSTLKEQYKNFKQISFIDLYANKCDPPRPPGWTFHGGLSPLLRARQQTRDVINMMLRIQDTSRTVLLVEDDFIFCPQSVTIMYHKIIFAETHVRFSAMRFGVGMSGILIWSSDIPLFSKYLAETQHNMPVDLLATEWFLAAMPVLKYKTMGQRQFIINKETLVSHIGDVSSFNDQRGIRKSSKCGEIVRVRSYFESKESYQTSCDAVELSPCRKFPVEHNLKVQIHGNIKPTSISRTNVVVMTKGGENCDNGCRLITHFDQCARTEMFKLNSCGLVKRYLSKCKVCIVEENVVPQAHGSDESGYTCVVPTFKTSQNDCYQKPKGNDWQRICVCQSREAQRESNKILAEKPNRIRI
jgi:hypothetical protein